MQRTALILLLLTCIAGIAMAQPGSAGMPLLTLGVTGRSVALGYTSAAEDGPGSVQGNPAGFQALQGASATRLLFTHQEWIQDTRTEFLGVALPVSEEQTLGISLITTSVSNIEIRTVPGPAEGTFTARDLAVGLSYAQRLSDVVRAGATARFLYQKIFSNEATGYSFDAGVRAALPVEGLDAGVSVMNIGSMTVLQNERTKLPSVLRGGVAYKGLMTMDFAYRLVGDLVRNLPEKRWYAGAGGEVWYQGSAALRVGDEFGSEGRGFTAGLGIAYSFLTVDYAFANLRENLGTSHTITLGLTL